MQTMNNQVQYARQNKQDYDDLSREAKQQNCCTPVCNAIGVARMARYQIGNRQSHGYLLTVNEMIKNPNTTSNPNDDQQGTDLGIIPNYWKLQEDFFQAVYERGVQLHQVALSAGMRYNLYNSGFPVKMGEDSDQFYSFVDALQPGVVGSCMPMPYFWVDGAGRAHIVTASICIQEVRTYSVRTTSGTRAQVTQTLNMAMRLADQAINMVDRAMQQYQNACSWSAPPCCWCSVLCCVPPCWGPICKMYELAGDALMYMADFLMNMSLQQVNNAYNMLQQGGTITTSSQSGTSSHIIVQIQDVIHPRTVSSSNFQFHVGGPVKGARGDIDTPTFYPPVQSGATASFAGGNIGGGQASHDARLISAH
jgi:hypothetical protein